MFRFVDPTNFLNFNPDLTDSGSSTINVLDQTVTLPLNLYHRLLNQHCKNDEMDDFFMYIYKVKLCSKKRAHDWTECPYAHRGEKAKRRDPRKFPYQGIICPVLRVKENVTGGQIVNFRMAYLSFGCTLVGSGPDCVSPDSCVLVEFASLLTVPSSFGLQSIMVLRAMQCQNKASSVQFRFQCSQE